jgi:hypothetical protein
MYKRMLIVGDAKPETTGLSYGRTECALAVDLT